MRRSISISVLLVILTIVLAPVAQASASSLPVCCRVGGQHHCMNTAGLAGFHSPATKCPYRVAPAVTSEVVALTTESLPVSIVHAESQVTALPAREPDLPAFGNVQKRGPPIA
jgi:NO-binding membrane sensor protein with MHYT domain